MRNGCVVIRQSNASDIDVMVSLFKTKPLAYEKSQPQFWRHNSDSGDNSQMQRFKPLFSRSHMLLVIKLFWKKMMNVF